MEKPCEDLRIAESRIDVDKSSSHQLSQHEIGSDNPVRDLYQKRIRPVYFAPHRNLLHTVRQPAGAASRPVP